MASLYIDSGQFESSFGVEDGYLLSRLTTKWRQNIANGRNLEYLILVIRDVRENEVWKRNIGGFTFDSIDDFFRQKLGIPDDFHYTQIEQLADEVEKIKKVKPKSISELKAYRNEKIKQMYENGMTQQQIADELGVSQQVVNYSLQKNRVMTPKSCKRNRAVYQISHYTKPETAASKIRDKFGDDFADRLKELL